MYSFFLFKFKLINIKIMYLILFLKNKLYNNVNE